MADEKSKTPTFGGLAKRNTASSSKPVVKHTMKVVKQSQKPGRKVDFEGEEVARLNIKLPLTTFNNMRRALIDSELPTQNQFVNAAILFFLDTANHEPRQET